MKYLLTVLLIAALSVFLGACGGEKATEEKAQPQAEKALDITPDMLATTTDPVCGMNLTAENLADTAIYQGKLYGFCSAEEKEMFKADPEKYLSAMKEGAEEHPQGEEMKEGGEHPQGSEMK